MNWRMEEKVRAMRKKVKCENGTVKTIYGMMMILDDAKISATQLHILKY